MRYMQSARLLLQSRLLCAGVLLLCEPISIDGYRHRESSLRRYGRVQAIDESDRFFDGKFFSA